MGLRLTIEIGVGKNSEWQRLLGRKKKCKVCGGYGIELWYEGTKISTISCNH